MKNKKIVNLEGVSLEENIPQGIDKLFIRIAQIEEDFIGQKVLQNGFIIKETTNKCTITLQLRKKLYSAKLKQLPNTKNWEIDGLIDHWENIDYLLI